MRTGPLALPHLRARTGSTFAGLLFRPTSCAALSGRCAYQSLVQLHDLALETCACFSGRSRGLGFSWSRGIWVSWSVRSVVHTVAARPITVGHTRPIAHTTKPTPSTYHVPSSGPEGCVWSERHLKESGQLRLDMSAAPTSRAYRQLYFQGAFAEPLFFQLFFVKERSVSCGQEVYTIWHQQVLGQRLIAAKPPPPRNMFVHDYIS
ncbi:unnamed protein product [Protopolystoma xenopodis]|uniref:Uncharacterized protein n=1 Tax=Protopolystoma xenopodis TaxID=117903 RepID=A0A3S4ZZQ8_9PLAT|nr:unnamed protein product [Protopolystoma xenopodis]